MADLILVGSEFAKRSFTLHGFDPEKIVVVPYGADLTLFRPAEKKPSDTSSFDILFVGQVGQRKGVADLLEAFDSIDDGATTLTLIGNPVGNMASLLPRAENIRHLPHLPKSELVQHMQMASVLVLPSHIEGMGLVVLEAMACGTPVVVSDRGPDQVVRDGIDGFIVQAGSGSMLEDRLRQLRDGTDLRQAMGRNAAERARTFGWESYVAGVRESIEQRLR